MSVVVSSGDRVRLYEEDDWFYEGMVVDQNSEGVLVDFDDWIERFPLGGFHTAYIHFERILLPTSGRGVIVQDFRIKAIP